MLVKVLLVIKIYPWNFFESFLVKIEIIKHNDILINLILLEDVNRFYYKYPYI